MGECGGEEGRKGGRKGSMDDGEGRTEIRTTGRTREGRRGRTREGSSKETRQTAQHITSHMTYTSHMTRPDELKTIFTNFAHAQKKMKMKMKKKMKSPHPCPGIKEAPGRDLADGVKASMG